MEISISQDRLLEIIAGQEEIASGDVSLVHVMERLAACARRIVHADVTAVELISGDIVSRVVDDGPGPRTPALSRMRVALTRQGRVLGAITAASRTSRAFAPQDELTLQLLAGVAVACIPRAPAGEDCRLDAWHDPLTGLGSERSFTERLGAEVARVRRHGGEVGVCVIDIDGLDEVNRTLGRLVGDEVLRAVARNLSRLRGEDSAFRRSDDEFAVILAGIDAGAAAIVAERLAAAIQHDRGCGGVTVTWGTAELEGGDPARLLAAAERALNQAKESSR